MVAIAKRKFQLVAADNHEEFFKVMNVDFLSRKAATASNQEISVTGENRAWEIKTPRKMKLMKMKFQPGVVYNETSQDGKDVIASVTLDGNIFVSEQTA